jgi:hypothetical protein
MKLAIYPNRKTANKRDPDNPFVATLNGDFIAVGTTALDAKDRAMSALYDAWKHRTDSPVVALAEDGSLFLGYYTGQDTVSLEHHDIDPTAGTLHRRCGYTSMLHKEHIAHDFTTYEFHSVVDAVKHHVAAWNKQSPHPSTEPSPAGN